jgi:hypothetical protein
VRDDEIDAILNGTPPAPANPRPEVLGRVTDLILGSLRPVRPMPPTWALISLLMLVCAAVLIGGALRVGLYGFDKMDALQRGLVYPVLVLLLWFAARTMVAEMIPASRRSVTAGALLITSCVGLAGLFALMFRDHSVENFVPIGIGCLIAGLQHAIPSALLSWFVVRRGLAQNPVSAGLVAGTLGGLAGVGMLELHCPNFETAHLVVWHIAVVPVSSALGALAGWVARAWRRSA